MGRSRSKKPRTPVDENSPKLAPEGDNKKGRKTAKALERRSYPTRGDELDRTGQRSMTKLEGGFRPGVDGQQLMKKKKKK